MSNRASGKTVRAVLKAARQVSKGQQLMIVGAGYHLSRHFIEQVGDLLTHFGYPPTKITSNSFRWPNGGAILMYHSREAATGSLFKEIKHI